MSLERDLQLWQQTGNSTHARNIANHLVTVLDQGKYEGIDKLNDVTVGYGSGAEIKSGLLWAVIETHEAKNKVLHEEVNRLKAELERHQKALHPQLSGNVEPLNSLIQQLEAKAVEGFVDHLIGALECGFVDEGPISMAELYQCMRNHAKDSYGQDIAPLAEKWGKEVAELCAIGMKEGEKA